MKALLGDIVWLGVNISRAWENMLTNSFERLKEALIHSWQYRYVKATTAETGRSTQKIQEDTKQEYLRNHQTVCHDRALKATHITPKPHCDGPPALQISSSLACLYRWELKVGDPIPDLDCLRTMGEGDLWNLRGRKMVINHQKMRWENCFNE